MITNITKELLIFAIKQASSIIHDVISWTTPEGELREHLYEAVQQLDFASNIVRKTSPANPV